MHVILLCLPVWYSWILHPTVHQLYGQTQMHLPPIWSAWEGSAQVDCKYGSRGCLNRTRFTCKCPRALMHSAPTWEMDVCFPLRDCGAGGNAPVVTRAEEWDFIFIAEIFLPVHTSESGKLSNQPQCCTGIKSECTLHVQKIWNVLCKISSIAYWIIWLQVRRSDKKHPWCNTWRPKASQMGLYKIAQGNKGLTRLVFEWREGESYRKQQKRWPVWFWVNISSQTGVLKWVNSQVCLH